MKAEYKDNAMEALEQAPSEVRRALFKQVKLLEADPSPQRDPVTTFFYSFSHQINTPPSASLAFSDFQAIVKTKGAELLIKLGFDCQKSL